jgi:hypothetical protein
MPYFNFDLVVGAQFKSQGGMILENTDSAIDKADSLASELCVVCPELCSKGCAVRVTDGESHEFYRTPVELIGRG